MTNKPASSLFRRAPPQPDANALELVARIVAAGSFAQAARDLGLTRAAISRRVAFIEAQLGSPLFARSTRALGLTEQGRVLAHRARAVLDAAESARRTLRTRGGDAGTLSGTLRVTSVASFGQCLLAPLLAQFQVLHPALRIDLRMGNRRVDLLREDIDVAFRITDRPPPDSVAQFLMSFKVRAYAAPVTGVPLRAPAELAHNRCLVFGPPTDELQLLWHQESSGQVESVTIEPAMMGDDAGTLQAAARAGAGVLFAADFSVEEDLSRGLLVEALPGWHLPVPVGSSVQALTLPVSDAPESARALVRHVREALGSRRA